MNKKHYSLLILGSGPAGCTAAIYAARANLNFAMITGLEQGGQLMNAPKIANWPGEPEEISGMHLMEKLIKQAHNFNANIISDNIEKADLSKHPFYLKGNESEYTCDALIIATGSSINLLGLPSEQKYVGRGISTCAVCDGFFYKNKNVAVVGGGNAAVEEVIYLAKIANQVTLIHRRDTLHAEAWLVDQLKKIPNVKLELNCNIIEILGDERGVTGARIEDVRSSTVKEIFVQGIFMAIGYKPNTEIFLGQLEMERNYIKVGYNFTTATSVPGVFAAGDVVLQSYRQAIIAAGSGCIAALDAKSFLS